MPLTLGYPNALPNNDSSSTWYTIPGRSYTYSGDVTINNVLYHLYNAGFPDSEIRVNTVTDTWEDHGSDHPFSPPVENGSNIELWYNPPGHPSVHQYSFAKPVPTSGSGGGGGTNTEEIVLNNNNATIKKCHCNFW